MYLCCHTYFSLKYGTISPEQMLEDAQRLGIKVLAVTDINNTSALPDMLRQSKRYGVRIVAGVDFRNGARQQFIALARNNDGYYEINRYLSTRLQEGSEIPATAPAFEQVTVVYPYGHKQPQELRPFEYMGIRLHELGKLLFTEWKHHQDKIILLHPVSFRNKKDFNAHRILRAVDTNRLLSQLPKSEEARPDEIMLPESELEKALEAYPLIVENTRRLLDECRFSMDLGGENGHHNLRHYTRSEEEDFELITRLCREGLPYRYPGKTDDEAILKRLENELNTIRQKGFVSYFLIAWDILNYARSKGYFYVGRGSGANSIVSYLMRITDVDPVELDLYFERFINLFRKNPPDFDIDFSWKDREDVTRYIFERFEHVTLLGAYSTFQYRSMIREIAKVFGLPEHEIKRLQQEGRSNDEVGRLVLTYSHYIHDFPSHLTVHSAGIIISERPIHHYTATFMPPKGYPTTHFDMHIAEDAGLYKFDILGQRGLAKVKDALEIIRSNRGTEVDIHAIQELKLDKASNDLLRQGMAIACFYVESPAMRMLLRKLEVGDYLGLVAASSVIRPGVAQSGMMRQYIVRHRQPEEREKARQTYPVLYELMPETYGVMVYQEDVIKVAHYFAGLTLAEADVLRRGMSGKYRSRQEFREVQLKFFANCAERGVSAEHTTEVWEQIESFAGYAFAKGHSASYAVESYQCLYLKAHYPLEFLVATVNNGGGFYSPEVYLHEARKHGATVHLPCVNNSDVTAGLQGTAIYLGLGMIASLETETIAHILAERQLNGPYWSVGDLVKRVAVSLEQLSLLIRAGAFAFTGKSKKELLWEAYFLLGKSKKTQPAATLFEPEVKRFALPTLWKHPLEDAFDELELFGFTVTSSPFILVKEMPPHPLTTRFFPQYKDKTVTLIGYLVHIKNTSTKDGKRMHFGTFIDLEGEWIDTVIFPPVADRYPFSGPGCYLLEGKVTEEFGFYSLEISRQRRIPSANMDEPPPTRLKKAEQKN